MSVSGGGFKTKVVLGCKMVLDLAEEADGQEGGANNDMEAVEACGHKEGGAVDAVGNCEGGFVVF